MKDDLKSHRKVDKAIARVLGVWGNDFKLCVKDGRVFVFIDTGAGVTCLGKPTNEALCKKLESMGLSAKFVDRKRPVSGVGGKVGTLGEAFIPLGICNKFVCVYVHL